LPRSPPASASSKRALDRCKPRAVGAHNG
jgi:hypothetical protein